MSRPAGFFHSLNSLAATFVAVLQTRADLISTEIEEERERLKEMILLTVVALFCVSLGVLLFTLLVVVVFWDTHRLYVLGGFSIFYLALGLFVGWIARKKGLDKPKFLSATLSELAKDRECLKS
ncbi:MAG: phage holin family protein [Deltaproteobacteria bacterium]|nr:phage holin family protein [Deltaproteobacteria bacterium]